MSKQANKCGTEFACDKQKHLAENGQCFSDIQIIADAVFSELNSEPPITGNSIIGVIIPVGTIIPVKALSFTLSTGAIIAAKANI
jgi:hypothetical protein